MYQTTRLGTTLRWMIGLSLLAVVLAPAPAGAQKRP